ncbi:MAG: hypothetical protein ACRDQZ_21370, partial [Mycobacteriales bacterium]
PQQLVEARRVVVIASGLSKRSLVMRLLGMRSFEEEFPLSAIHHPDIRDRVTLFLTNDIGIDLARY